MLVIITFSGSRQKEIDWSPTFINTKTEPYGTYIAFNLIKDIFNRPISVTRKPIYNNLKPIMSKYFYYEDGINANYEKDSYDGNNSYYEDDTSDQDETETDTISISDDVPTYTPAPDSDNVYIAEKSIYDGIELNDTTAYIFINRSFRLDNLDLEYLLDFVGIGNNVFISAETFDQKLLDSLDIKNNHKYWLSSDTIYYLNNMPGKAYPIRSIGSQSQLSIDSCKFPVSVLSYNEKGQPVFLNIKYGKGKFYLHAVPNAFSNINQLDINKYDYAYRCLSYLPRGNKVLWDEYQKQGLIGEYSIFRVLLDNDALRASLYLTLIGIFLFMIFKAKRIQRVIPILKPPVNSSVEFLETISNLYYRKKDFKTIIEKRQAYFLNYIRKNYYLPTEIINDEFFEILSAKSGMETIKLKAIFNLYNLISATNKGIPNVSFIKYNSLLEEFYRSTQK